jgi:flagellar basal-body rod protein FlgC
VLAGVDVLGIVESTAPPIERYDPGNPQANADGVVYASSVNAMEEMANMISASRSYQSNLEVINTAKDLLMRTLSLGQV